MSDSAAPSPTFGRYAEIAYDAMTPEQQEGYRALADVEGDGSPNLPGPLKIWTSNPALALAVAPLAKHFRPPHHSLTPREREIAVTVLVARWKAPFAVEAHAKVLATLGLDPSAVDALVEGRPVRLEDARERLVHEVAYALAHDRRITRHLYERAVATLGHDRLCDLTVLMGLYSAVSLTLLFYDVPAEAKGLQRPPAPAAEATPTSHPTKAS